MITELASRIPLQDAAIGLRLLRNLPPFLRRRISVDEARSTMKTRLERREMDFLALVRGAIFENPETPYQQLLRIAGCEFGDLERLVAQDGVEGALRSLYRSGVYLTIDEYKGRRPTVRGSATLAVEPTQLRNPFAAAHMPFGTSGSRGARTAVAFDLAWMGDHAVSKCLALEARGGREWVHGLWCVPGGASMFVILVYSRFGATPVRWFSQVDPSAPGLHPRYRWSARLLRLASILAGAPVPAPRYMPLDDCLLIARWMAGVLRSGRTPHLYTFPSSAASLCQAAHRAGIDLTGAQFTVDAEPVTVARLAAIRESGANPVPAYGSVESAFIGYWCLKPEATDDIHLSHDLHAVIQAGEDNPNSGLPPLATLFSSIRRTAPLILLNLSLGDQAVLSQRDCGCPLEEVGWKTHLYAIRSYEKLTAGGMTFLDTDVIRVLEEVLPSHFGGGPTDFQLVEQEDDDGRPRLRLLVHPGLGNLEAEQIADVFLNSIGGGSGVERVMELQWRQANVVSVERRPPIVEASGKVLHLHIERGLTPSRAPVPA